MRKPKALSDFEPAEVLANPAVSEWLKDALEAAIKRDPIEAANDAETLAQVLRGHMLRTLSK